LTRPDSTPAIAAAPLLPGEERLDDGGTPVERPVHRVWAAREQHEHRRGAGVQQRLDEPALHTGQVERVGVAALAGRADRDLRGSDMQAVGVYQEAAARGLRIPEDLSVVGLDDIAFCEYMTPLLTTVRQPLGRMAAEAVRLVLAAGASAGAEIGGTAGPPPRVDRHPPRPPGKHGACPDLRISRR
jgi:hypothetical protein